MSQDDKGMYDVIVVGSGNAGFCAAVAAKEQGARNVLLVDKCPEEWAGGNTYFTAGAYRTVFKGLQDILTLVHNVDKDTAELTDMEAYSADDFHRDLMRVTQGRAEPALARVLIGESRDTVAWLAKNGIKFQLSFNRQAYKINGRYNFWGGMVLSTVDGGKGLVKQHQEAARRHGIEVRYSSAFVGFCKNASGAVCGINLHDGQQLESRAVILCCGGFEASPRLRAQYLGPNWDMAHVRGTPYNTGDGIDIAQREVYARFAGNFTGCHSVCWDAASPANTGDQQLTNQFTKSGYPLGLMLNTNGQRFVDEGIDMRNFTYAKFGKDVLKQPGGQAFQVWDAVGAGWLREEEYADKVCRKIYADSIEELGEKLLAEGLQSKGNFIRCIHEYNDAVRTFQDENPNAKFDPSVKDGLSTQSSRRGLALAKSNWAMPLVKRPFAAVKITCGITFTFGGLAIEPNTAAVISETSGMAIPGLYAAGEIVGGAFFENYPGGSGLTLGSILGRKSGMHAAKFASQLSKGTRQQPRI